jgi:Sulfatase-modifying factor enzyme 1
VKIQLTDHVFVEINCRVASLQATAASDKQPILAPLLVLGTSERVGSNWLSDSLRSTAIVHNEPWRQQLGSEHPLSALSPAPRNVADVELGELGQHWLATFVVSKYGPPRHLVKETNLFFATATVLRLFPDAPIAVLSRSPLGVASSFSRGGLWHRWRYADRYSQLRAATQQPSHRRWAPLLPDDDPNELVALTRLVVLGAVVLADAIADRDHIHVAYEDRVLQPRTAAASLDLLVPATESESPLKITDGQVDDTFSTRKDRSELVALLDEDAAQLVQRQTRTGLAVAETIADNAVVARATRWLSRDHRYRLSPTAPRTPRPAATATDRHLAAQYTPHAGLAWRNLLVTNREYAAMLNQFQAAGLTNSHQGTHLLLTVMPHERGGRIHFDASRGWHVSAGYERHPAYWVTWIGAAAFAAFAGARLPSFLEVEGASVDVAPSNTDYAVGDVVPVVEPDQPADAVHHLVGNVQVWCGDGPPDDAVRPVQRYLFGAAWNTPDSRAEIARRRSRHLLGSSRGVGIRLVRDPGVAASGRSAESLAEQLRAWLTALTDRHLPLPHLDGLVVEALTLSQSDVRLGAHVGPGTGKACLAELNEAVAESELD